MQVRADRVGAEHAERGGQDEQHDRVVDELGQQVRGVVLAAVQGGLDPAALDETAEDVLLAAEERRAMTMH